MTAILTCGPRSYLLDDSNTFIGVYLTFMFRIRESPSMEDTISTYASIDTRIREEAFMIISRGIDRILGACFFYEFRM